MFTKQILRHILSQATDVSFIVTYWDGTTEWFGRGDPAFGITVHDEKVLDLLRHDFELGFADAYVAGLVDIDGDIADVMAIAVSTMEHCESKAGSSLEGIIIRTLSKFGRRSPKQQRSDVEHHYDLGNDFFSLWLDESMTYSCAYFRSADDTIEDAQRQKIDHSLRKLRLRDGDRLLDIGCGWGALMRRAADVYGANVLGITLSKEQYAYTCNAVHEAGLDSRADVRLQDYVSMAREGIKFDKIVSIGMIEHVGKTHLPEFVDAVSSLLLPHGVALLHCITSPREAPFCTWLDRHIFPGAYLPTVPELTQLCTAKNMRILGVENLRPHYRLTLDRWSERFEEHVPEIRSMYGEEFVRMWRLYLRGCSAAFRMGTVEVHQFLVSNGITNEVPLTREDIYAVGA